MNTSAQVRLQIEAVSEFAKNRPATIQWDASDALMKWDEEFGELAEVVLISIGSITHKTINESIFSEPADNINQLFDWITLTEFPARSFELNIDDISFDKFQRQYQHFLNNHPSDPSEQKFVKEFYLMARRLRNELHPNDEEDVRLLVYTFVLLGFYLALLNKGISFDSVNESQYDEVMTEFASVIGSKLEKWKRIHAGD